MIMPMPMPLPVPTSVPGELTSWLKSLNKLFKVLFF
jgi:hypothetical protein